MWRYERALAAYLKRRFAATPDGELRAYTVAASVLATHSYGLRTWLRSGADGDVASAVDHALDLVHRALGVRPVRRSWSWPGPPPR
ncbi:hypothetical protein CGL27_47385 [Streptomyces sp. 11-1-2]|nr:hypothetical protein CGL27_47385 [Streptomyces sp. 11-1-2]